MNVPNQRKVPWLDTVLGAVALVIGLETLLHPFGRDQGLYFYVGREWFLRGKLPYRDSFDVKTPGIYIVNGIAAYLFGDKMWGPRLFDIVALLLLGGVCAVLGTPKHKRMTEGTLGLCLLSASVLYFGFFDFWNTAQCEVWCALFGVASFTLLVRSRRPLAVVVVSGLCGGLSVLFKPTGGVFCVLSVLAMLVESVRVLRRGRRYLPRVAPRFAAHVCLYAIAAAIPLAVVFGHIYLKGGGAAMYDVLVVNNRHYVLHGKWVHSSREALRLTRAALYLFEPLGTLVWLPLGLSLFRAFRNKRRDASRRGLPFLLLMAVAAQVWAQMKFPLYHWGGIVAPLVVGIAIVHGDLRAWMIEKGRNARYATAVAVGLLTYAFYLNGPTYDRWIRPVWAAIPYATGRMPREDYLEAFPTPYFSIRRTEQTAAWLRRYSLPGDRLSVRGFEPQIYAAAGLEGHGRFFWTTFLRTPEWAYDMEAWQREDLAVFQKNPPRWVVAMGWVHEGLDSPEYFEKLGYHRMVEINDHVIMEYTPDGRVPSVLVRPIGYDGEIIK